MAADGLLAETVPFRGHGNDEISGYLARPTSGGPYPGVVVIHAVAGIVTHIKEVARRIADHGYVTLAPDLHHREGPGEPDDVAAVVRAAGGNPDARTIGDVEGAMRHLRSIALCTGKIGVIGYCSGGRQTYLVACNIPSIDAAVSCYGGRIVTGPEGLNPRQPKAPIDMTKGMKGALLGLFGIEDANPSPEQVQQIEQELKRHRKTYEIKVYENASHGFFADYRPSYRQHAAVDGWERVFTWFGKHLG